MDTDKNSDWRAPHRWDWRTTALRTSAALALALAAILVVVMTRTPAAPPPAMDGPTARPLSALEAAGVQAMLERQKAGAHKLAGTVTDAQGRTYGVQLSMTGNSAAGVGTITAGSTRGEALLDRGTVYLRGEQDFWAALGVTGRAPEPPGWVSIGGEFLGGKLFMAPSKWTADLSPSPTALLDGDRYSQGSASALIGDSDVTHVTVDGLDIDISTVTAQSVTDAAAPLVAGRGTPAVLKRAGNGGWMLSPTAGPPGSSGAEDQQPPVAPTP